MTFLDKNFYVLALDTFFPKKFLIELQCFSLSASHLRLGAGLIGKKLNSSSTFATHLENQLNFAGNKVCLGLVLPSKI